MIENQSTTFRFQTESIVIVEQTILINLKMNFLGTLFGIQQQEDDDDSSSDEHKLSEPVEEHVLETTILDTSINQEPTVTEVDNDNIMENNDNDANVPSSNGGRHIVGDFYEFVSNPISCIFRR